MLAGLAMAAQGAFAQGPAGDGNGIWRTMRIDSVMVSSTRASATTPMVYTNVNKAKIANENYGQDVPFLLQFTPSVVVTSDSGVGMGYTGIRIRGTDATRINVTANGVPMNDAESHSLFWVNTPDFVSSVGSIQIQRGVGTSTNGAGAFGGSINMMTEPIPGVAYGEVSASFGSYNTHKETFKFGTGMIDGRWAFDVRLSNIQSDGYRDRASTDMKSYFAQGAYYAKNTVIRFVTYGGKEVTYHAWNAVSKDEMKDNGRRYNPSGEIYEYVLNPDGSPLLDEYGDPETKFAGYYKNQDDNYVQSNYHMHVNHAFNDRWSLTAALHYTKGDGYYEEYKNGRTLKEYALKPYSFTYTTPAGVARDTTVTKSNLVRRKEMDNHFGGGVFSLDYDGGRLKASLGGAANIYDGDHFGRVMWVQNYAGDPSFEPGHEYYRNNGTKKDANIYLRANWEAARGLFLYGDVQYRRINYVIGGENDNWDWTWNNYEGAMQKLDVDDSFNFFNPKAGVFYRIDDRWYVYGSVAVAHREPTRNNYTDAKKDLETGKYAQPKAERLTDYEAGGMFHNRGFSAGVNLYYMKYRDQLILTGEVNHIGEPLADNVPDSYRAGVEFTAGVQIAPWLRWDVNATLSRNRIKDYTEYLDNYDENWSPLYTQTANDIGDTDISFSPDFIAGSNISVSFQRIILSLQTAYVGKQYVTNSGIDRLSLKDYCVNNLRMGYTFRFPSVKTVRVGIAVNNIFNAKYSSNGYGGSSMVGTERTESMYYFPQATANVLANITVKF